MRPVSTLLILTLFTLLIACGKDNKSGKRNNGYFGFNQLGTSGAYGGSAITYNGLSLQQVIQQNPCVGGIGNGARMRITSQAPVNTVIANGDVYVGVTSYGDVAAIGGTPQGPVFEAYICARSMMSQAASTPFNVSLFPYTNCGFKQMNASLRLADGSVANFRMMDFGTSTGARFPYCR